MISHDTIEQIIFDFIADSPENSLKMEKEEPAWEEALVGFSSGSDPIYDSYKEHVGEFHYTPAEIFQLTFPESQFQPEDLTVISWILLQREVTKKDNRAEDTYPAKRWIMARFPGEEFNSLLRKQVVQKLAETEIKAVAPILSPHWQTEDSIKFTFSSRWSERHAAYAAGLGTFGLCDGLITPRGKAHRIGSVVAQVRLEPTLRAYDDHHAYCLFFSKEKCLSCAKRCPVEAITEKGHDKKKCREYVRVTCGKYVKENYNFDGYGCGLCQTKVPCENGIPKGIVLAGS